MKKDMNFIVGGVARGVDNYFHHSYATEILTLLGNDNVLLLSPRRTGKTSLMYRLLDNSKDNQKVIHLNVEALGTAADFYLSLLTALRDFQPVYVKKLVSAWGGVKKLFCSLEEVKAIDFKIKFREITGKDWQKLADELMEQIINSGESVLFIIDEFPDFLNEMLQKDREEADVFLHHFRQLRLNPKANKIRWLVAGSVNIRGVLDEENLIQLINDFKTEILPVIKDEEASNFISDMLTAKGIVFDEDVIKQMMKLLGEPMPYFLQLFTQELYRHCSREKVNEISITTVDFIFNTVLLGQPAQDKLQHYYSRIEKYYPQNMQKSSRYLLDILSKSDVGISERQLFSEYRQMQATYTENNVNIQEAENLFKKILLRLESDFYISENNHNKYLFKSHLIKLWWRKNWAQS
ncbi:hypothetical protein [uncultured Gammaproteobacteria bacterium]|nr:hypothetical protein [uncultured Gammaproteobacteria bacterium]